MGLSGHEHYKCGWYDPKTGKSGSFNDFDRTNKREGTIALAIVVATALFIILMISFQTKENEKKFNQVVTEIEKPTLITPRIQKSETTGSITTLDRTTKVGPVEYDIKDYDIGVEFE